MVGILFRLDSQLSGKLLKGKIMSLYNRVYGWRQIEDREITKALVSAEFKNEPAAVSLGITTNQFKKRWGAISSQLHNDEAKQMLRGQMVDSVFAAHADGIYKNITNLIQEKFRPKTLALEFQTALRFAQTDDKISGIVGTKRDFSLSGFRTAASDSKEEEKINEYNESSHLSKILTQIFESISATDTAVVLWQKKGNTLTVFPLPSLIVLPLHTSDSNGRPKFRTFYKIPPEIRKLIHIKNSFKGNEDPLKTKKTTTKTVKIPSFPKHWVDAVTEFNSGKIGDPLYPRGGYVELGGTPSEQVFILNINGIEDRLVSPSMKAVFAAATLREILQEGEFATSYLMTDFIHQIKVGEKEQPSGNLKAALANKALTPEEKNQIRDLYASLVDKAFLEVTGPDHQHEFLFPGSEVTYEKRYQTADKKINQWARISDQIIDGSNSGSFSGGLIYLKSYAQLISGQRSPVSQFLRDLYKIILNISKTKIQWDNNYLKEAKQILEEIRFQTSRGMPMETASSYLGTIWEQWVVDKEKTMDPETLGFKESKEKSYLYYRALEIPIFEPSQGGANSGDQDLNNGRPEEDGKQTDPTNSPDNPRPEAG